MFSFPLEQERNYIMDIPVHRHYIPETFSNIISTDVAMLVISEKENQFDVAFHKRQLKQHVLLSKGSFIDNIIVAMNKMDVMGREKESFDSIEKTIF